MAFKRVAVTLHHLLNENTGPDPGNGLEVFGRLDVGRVAFKPAIGANVTVESINLWDRGGNEPQDIVEGTAFNIENQRELHVFSGEHLWFTGFLSDHDTIGSDDHLGNIDHRVAFNDIVDQILPLPILEEGNQKVIVKMSMVVLGQG